jgi:hypothetical protein
MLSLVLRHYVQAVLAAALLFSPAANAGQSRGLSLATAETPPASTPSTSIDAAAPPAPAPVDEPEKAHNTPTGPTTEARAAPKKHKIGSEARIILDELHRHGIYW